jgi:hypothetical protein
MSDEKPERPPSRPVVVVIELDRRVSIDEVAEALMSMTPYFQRVTLWGSPLAFVNDKENEYIINKDDPFVGWQPTGLVH